MKSVSDYSKLMQYNKTTSLLIAVNTWRIVGIAFLWGMTQGILDPAFAIPAGIGDILIGVTAIPFAIFLWKGYSWSKYAVIVWTVLGIADLVNAVTLGLITNPDFSTSTMTTFPWILVPTVAVPTALILHGITLYRLRKWVPKQAYGKPPEA
ncbi:MAG: hypothetical protein M3M83_02745 [Thermoproteota archaeon]|nr:hypothetical protein [Thermoproteota archaeon]